MAKLYVFCCGWVYLVVVVMGQRLAAIIHGTQVVVQDEFAG